MVTRPVRDERSQIDEDGPASVSAATRARFNPDTRLITVELRGGYSLLFSPERAQGLESAATDELSDIEIESSGHSIYFSRLDADFSVPNMLKGNSVAIGGGPNGSQPTGPARPHKPTASHPAPHRSPQTPDRTRSPS